MHLIIKCLINEKLFNCFLMLCLSNLFNSVVKWMTIYNRTKFRWRCSGNLSAGSNKNAMVSGDNPGRCYIVNLCLNKKTAYFQWIMVDISKCIVVKILATVIIWEKGRHLQHIHVSFGKKVNTIPWENHLGKDFRWYQRIKFCLFAKEKS